MVKCPECHKFVEEGQVCSNCGYNLQNSSYHVNQSNQKYALLNWDKEIYWFQGTKLLLCGQALTKDLQDNKLILK